MTATVSEPVASDTSPLRVGIDYSISRHPQGGTLRWANGLISALGGEEGLEVVSWRGPSRIRRGGPVRKVLNLLLDESWLEVGLPRRAERAHAHVLLMPSNVTSGHARIPQVVTIHDVNFLVAPGTYDRAYAAYAERRFRRSLRQARRATTVSEYSRTQIIERLGADPARVSVVYPGLSTPPAGDYVSPHPRPYVLYVGHTEPHKDVPTAVRAMGFLEDLDVDLAIVGQPGRAHDLLLRQSAGNPRVTIVGSVADPVWEAWYRNAAVFVFPSRAEGFGFPPLEAMARGVPVVASRAASLPEVLGSAALFHEPGDAEELAHQVRRVLEDAELARRLSDSGRKRAATYTWASCGDRMAAILRDVAGGQAS